MAVFSGELLKIPLGEPGYRFWENWPEAQHYSDVREGSEAAEVCPERLKQACNPIGVRGVFR